MTADDRTVSVTFTPAEHERLTAVADDPAELVHEAAVDRVELAEAITYTDERRFAGPDGFRRMTESDPPTWPCGELVGLEARSMGDGEARWVMEAGPEHANPMGTLHGGVLCDLGDAAMGSAFMSTVGDDESFTTVDLSVNFLRPVWSGRLTADARVVHRGRTIGLCECDVQNEDGDLVARLAATCLVLRGDQASTR